MVLSTKNFYNTKNSLNSFEDILNLIYGSKVHSEDMFVTFMGYEIDDHMRSYVNSRLSANIELLRTLFRRMYECNDLSYREYKIPKKKGGFREIAEPNIILKDLQKMCYQVLMCCHIFPNNKSYAYISNRGVVDMANEHRKNKHVVKMDLKNFFPSITEELLRKVLLRNYAFMQIHSYFHGFIDQLIRIACYKGSLPQGSPLSPYLSNLIMVEFDYLVTKTVGFVKYTRYADDMVFSSNQYLSPKKLTRIVNDSLKACFDKAIKLNEEKTKVLKTTGRCYVVGVKINNNNEISFGHEKKKKLKYQLYNMFKAYEQDQDSVPKEQIQETLGLFSYMKQIEPAYAKYLERKLLKQFNSSKSTLGKHFKY